MEKIRPDGTVPEAHRLSQDVRCGPHLTFNICSSSFQHVKESNMCRDKKGVWLVHMHMSPISQMMGCLFWKDIPAAARSATHAGWSCCCLWVWNQSLELSDYLAPFKRLWNLVHIFVNKKVTSNMLAEFFSFISVDTDNHQAVFFGLFWIMLR